MAKAPITAPTGFAIIAIPIARIPVTTNGKALENNPAPFANIPKPRVTTPITGVKPIMVFSPDRPTKRKAIIAALATKVAVPSANIAPPTMPMDFIKSGC